MLDLNHPKSQYVLEASTLLDEIRTELLALEKAKGSAEVIGRTEHIRLVVIPKLRLLNKNHFDDSSEITRGLGFLSKAVNSLDYKQAWKHLIELEGQAGKDNFGVWAI